MATPAEDENGARSRGRVVYGRGGWSHSGQAFSLVRNVIDGLGTDYSVFLGGDNLFVIRSNTVVNPVGFFGDGVALPPTAHVEVVNNIIYAPAENAQSFACVPQEAFDIRYNCFFNMYPKPCTLGPSNIIADPLLCDFVGEDYRLHPDSPCVGAGEGGATIGAFPVGCGFTAIQESPSHRHRLNVDPNPIAGSAEFSFDGSIGNPVLEIFDPNGRLVDLIHPLSQKVRWSPSGSWPRGVYFARLWGTGVYETVKFLVIR